MPRKPASEKISKDAIAQYFAADLDSLTQRAIQYENILSNKINFYLVIVTASLGGLILAADIPEIKESFLFIASLVVLILFFIGWTTLFQTLDLSTNSTYMYRRIGRIRQWFLSEMQELYLYLPFNSGDDKPDFDTPHAKWRRVDSILIIVNATLAVIFFVFLWFFFCFQVFHFRFVSPEHPYLIALGMGTIIFTIVWRIELKYVENFMIKRDEEERMGKYIHFPSDDVRNKFEKRSKK
jgi:protein-S-isoprenylcysteine O-methyltransferase Ste14